MPLVVILIMLAPVVLIIFGFIGAHIAKTRQLHAGAGFILGLFMGPVGLAVILLLKPSPPSTSKFFGGERDIADSRYQLYLTQAFGIENNAVLNKFTASGRTFDTLNDALAFADERDVERETATRQKSAASITTRKRFLNILIPSAVLGGALLVASPHIIGANAERKALDDLKSERATIKRQISQEVTDGTDLMARARIVLPARISAEFAKSQNYPALIVDETVCDSLDIHNVDQDNVYYMITTNDELELPSAYNEILQTLQTNGYTTLSQKESDFSGFHSRRAILHNNEFAIELYYGDSDRAKILNICIVKSRSQPNL